MKHMAEPISKNRTGHAVVVSLLGIAVATLLVYSITNALAGSTMASPPSSSSVVVLRGDASAASCPADNSATVTVDEAVAAVMHATGLGGHLAWANSSVRFAHALKLHLDMAYNTFTYHTPRGKPERHAYAILYMDDDRSHLCGVRALIASIRASGSDKDVLAIVPSGTTTKESTDYLKALGYIVKEVPLIRPNVQRDGYYASVFTSLNLWNLDDYDRVVKLDSDMVVLQNMDELFMYNVFAATLDWPAGKPIDWPDCKETELCQHTSHDWRPTHLNGAMFVLQPNRATYDDMMGILQRHEEQLEGGPSEQGFLNWYFKNKWFALPYYYNVRDAAINYFPQLFLSVTPRTFHYIGAYKPWKAPWDCNRNCRADPLRYLFNSEWYRFYNMVPITPETTPPGVQCYDFLIEP